MLAGWMVESERRGIHSSSSSSSFSRQQQQARAAGAEEPVVRLPLLLTHLASQPPPVDHISLLSAHLVGRRSVSLTVRGQAESASIHLAVGSYISVRPSVDRLVNGEWVGGSDDSTNQHHLIYGSDWLAGVERRKRQQQHR